MSRASQLAVLTVALCAIAATADDLIYRYEGESLPYAPDAGWIRGNQCNPPCQESVVDGHFVIEWLVGDLVTYDLIFTRPPAPSPPSLWVEWRYRSNASIPPTFVTCDAFFLVDFLNVFESVDVFGDAVLNFSGDFFVLGLAANQFHTMRFESPDGLNFNFSVDGVVFWGQEDNDISNGLDELRFGGEGDCPGPEVVRNEWDFIRYGTLGDGEGIVSSDPPSGVLDAGEYPALDRFTVTFDQANYVYVDDVTIAVTGTKGQRDEGTKETGHRPLATSHSYPNRQSTIANRQSATTAGGAPLVLATRRLDNGPPETVQIVLDRPLEVGVTYRFTFATGGTPNTVEYTLLFPTGACCDLVPGTCTDDVTAADCSGGQQTWTEGTACAQAACEPVTGACCNGDPFSPCTEGATLAQCQCPTCQWTKEALCGDVDCPRSVIPAVSLWGVAVLALLLLIAAKLKLRLRPAPAGNR